jgi:hypothetical protein
MLSSSSAARSSRSVSGSSNASARSLAAAVMLYRTVIAPGRDLVRISNHATAHRRRVNVCRGAPSAPGQERSTKRAHRRDRRRAGDYLFLPPRRSPPRWVCSWPSGFR